MDIWKNPIQQFGMINIHVLIGKIEPDDYHLFFGPRQDGDTICQQDIFGGTFGVLRKIDGYVCKLAEFDGDVNITLPQLLSRLGIFDSSKDAQRSGFKGPIPEGFSDYMRIRKMHRVTILKITQPHDRESCESNSAS